MQARSADGQVYRYDRDLCNNFGAVCRRAIAGMAEADWQAWFGDYLRHAGITDWDMDKAAAGLVDFVRRATDPHTPNDPAAAFEAAGFFAAPAPAQLATMALIGQVTCCLAWGCIRDALPAGAPPRGLAEMVAASDAVLERLRTPPCPPCDCPEGVCNG